MTSLLLLSAATPPGNQTFCVNVRQTSTGDLAGLDLLDVAEDQHRAQLRAQRR